MNDITRDELSWSERVLFWLRGKYGNNKAYHYNNTGPVEICRFFFLDDITNEQGLYHIISLLSFPFQEYCKHTFCCPAIPVSCLPMSSMVIIRILSRKPSLNLQLAQMENNTQLLRLCWNSVWPTTWLWDGEVSPPCTMPLSGLLSVRSLCSS